jgi:hypothetical protein
MGLAVKFIRPEGEEMDHTVETFLTKFGAEAMIEDLHRLVLAPANSAPVFNETEVALHLRKIVEPPLAGEHHHHHPSFSSYFPLPLPPSCSCRSFVLCSLRKRR